MGMSVLYEQVCNDVEETEIRKRTANLSNFHRCLRVVSTKREGPMVVVDACDDREHDSEKVSGQWLGHQRRRSKIMQRELVVSIDRSRY